jgi:hypothetical protein
MRDNSGVECLWLHEHCLSRGYKASYLIDIVANLLNVHVNDWTPVHHVVRHELVKSGLVNLTARNRCYNICPPSSILLE